LNSERNQCDGQYVSPRNVYERLEITRCRWKNSGDDDDDDDDDARSEQLLSVACFEVKDET